jgi:hypothetical protein
MVVMHRSHAQSFQWLAVSRHIALCLAGGVALLAMALLPNAGSGAALAAMTASTDYTRLIQWMTTGSFEKPLMAVGELETAFSAATHEANLEFIRNHPDLIGTIKSQLNSSELSWYLVDARQRFLAVPEKRVDFAEMFEAYCREAIAYVAASTGFNSPYGAIFTLVGDTMPDISTAPGMKVLLVHNLAAESVYTYAFRGTGEKTISVALNQILYTGELGFYTSYLLPREDGCLEFEPSRLTIWQNTAENPYSVLTVPVEETLHIHLRSATEQAIRADLDHLESSEAGPGGVVEEWVAVEEAIVGGLVHHLLPGFLEQHLDDFQFEWIEDDLSMKKQMDRYRYLHRGIQIVGHIGTSRAMAIYLSDPYEFRLKLQQ